MSKRKQLSRRPGRLAVERLEDRENPNGTVTASLTAGGVLFLRGDALDNDIQLQVTGSGAVVTGLNGTQISAGGSVGGSATLDGQVKHINASLLAGNDSISIDAVSAFAVSGNAAFNLGAGNNNLDLSTAAALNIGGHLIVRAAAGNDTIAVRGGLGSAINGNAMIALGAGGSTVNIEDLSINGAAGLKVFAGAGVDSVTLDSLVLSRGSAHISAGLDQLNVDLTGAIDVAGRVGVSGAAGIDVDVAGGTFGSIFVAGGAGSAVTNVNIAGATNIATDLRVRGANATLDADAALSVGRHTVVTGANAAFDATGASLSLGKNLFVSAGTKATVNLATSGNADIAGNLIVLGGIDGDDIDANANLTVNGNTALLLRGGNNDVSLGSSGDLDLNGNLVIFGGAGNDDVTLNQVKVDGNTVIRLGAGNDTLIVDGGTEFLGFVFVDLGAGIDTLAVANDPLASAGVTFHGQTILSTGFDNDVIDLGTALTAGGTLNTNATFLAAGNVLNAGLGVDLFLQANAQIFGALGVFGVP